MTMMAMVSLASPISPEMTAAARSTRIMKSVNWSANMRRGVRRFPSVISFGPTAARRRCTSCASNPCGVLRSASNTASTDIWCQGRAVSGAADARGDS